VTAPHPSELDEWEPDTLMHDDDEFSSDVEVEQDTLFSHEEEVEDHRFSRQ